MDGGVRIVAALYVLAGIVGFLPFVLLLMLIVPAFAFWALALRTANPPVSLGMFFEGLQVGVLAPLSDFPFGLAGLGLVALQCLLSLPNLIGGLALLRRPEASRPWAPRLALLNLIAFPVGTVLAVLTFWALARPRSAGAQPQGQGVGYLFGRLKGAAGALVDRGVGVLNETGALMLHRSRLAGGGTKPGDVRPKVEGLEGPAGFTQSRGGTLDVLMLVIVFFVFLTIAGLFAKLAFDVSAKGAARVNWLVAVPALLTFGGFGSLILFMFGRRILGGLAHRAELSIARWPLRPGEISRLRLRTTSRGGAKVERIAASLQCVEAIRFTDKNSRTQWTNAVARVDTLPEATPLASPDGSASVEWNLRVPRDAPTSFASPSAALTWRLEVEVRAAGLPDGTLSFDLLVLPESAGK